MAWLELCKDELCSKVEHVQKLWHQRLTLSYRIIFESLRPLSTFVHIYGHAYMGRAEYICRIYAVYIYGAVYMESVCGNPTLNHRSKVCYYSMHGQQ
jgi:hypothetical protein